MRSDCLTKDETAAKFRYWQSRTLIAAMVGYIGFYFVRKNMSIAMPAMEAELGVSKAALGIFLTLHGLLYGVSKFVNGYWGDRVNARIFMVAGLSLSAVANIFFGMGSTALFLGIVWMLNGWVQGMGFPPCARLMTHWFPPERLATKMSIWNTSHSIGAGLVVIGCGYIVGFGWRWCFWGPAILALVIAGMLWFALRDTPSSVGLPEIECGNPEKQKEQSAEAAADFKRFVRKHVFGNPYIWLIALANFFVYTLRYSVLDWGPTLLTETKGIALAHAGWMVAAFEVAGVTGMLVAGWATDRIFAGRGARVCMICMLMASIAVFFFWKMASSSFLLSTVLLGMAGFFIYGPQALVGIAVSNLATKRAAATAVGFTGLFGYASTILSGWGLGQLVQAMGWNFALGAMVFAGLMGVLLFALAWPARANGYND